ncbi:enoyl-CoA hydratase/isomerase family protein [Nocardia sp. NPDC059239]|uniref:enoyl-CoA hydratase/isomerase family protein n=1 Tax=unclassified Nocardia TaxID=2637762 RepID=UPI00369AD207
MSGIKEVGPVSASKNGASVQAVTADGEVGYSVEGPVAVITLDRPGAHNAFTVDMARQLAAATDAARRNDSVHVVIVTGAGEKAFCAGGDLGELIPRLTRGELDVLISDPVKRYFSDVHKPVIAAVNGICVAGGLEILLGTDIRIAAEHATFGVPEVRWGLVPGGGTHVRLPQQVPWAMAMQLLLTGDHIDAHRAAACGLVNEVVPAGQELPRAIEIATRIATNAPLAVRASKEIAVRALANEPRFALEFALTERVVRSDDAKEGPRAFMEKRAPRYRSR